METLSLDMSPQDRLLGASLVCHSRPQVRRTLCVNAGVTAIGELTGCILFLFPLFFLPSGKYLVCGTSGRTSSNDDEQGDGILRVFDVQRAKEAESVVSGHEDVNLVDFSPCETYVISCSHRNEVAVFDRRFYRQEPLHRFQHLHKDDDEANAGITTALWWPTGLLGTSQCMLVSGGGDGAVRIWDIRRATEDAQTLSFDTHVGPVARMVASSSFEHLLVGADTGAVSAFTLDHGIVTQYANKPMTLLTDQDEEML